LAVTGTNKLRSATKRTFPVEPQYEPPEVCGYEPPPQDATRRSAFERPWDQTTRTNIETDLLVLLYDVARHMRAHADQIARQIAREHGMTRARKWQPAVSHGS
jgi:hypothetical protein